jgi:hypothetical protein
LLILQNALTNKATPQEFWGKMSPYIQRSAHIKVFYAKITTCSDGSVLTLIICTTGKGSSLEINMQANNI